MTLEKDPQQEDFLQGRMQGNPYRSVLSYVIHKVLCFLLLHIKNREVLLTNFQVLVARGFCTASINFNAKTEILGTGFIGSLRTEKFRYSSLIQIAWKRLRHFPS